MLTYLCTCAIWTRNHTVCRVLCHSSKFTRRLWCVVNLDCLCHRHSSNTNWQSRRIWSSSLAVTGMGKIFIAKFADSCVYIFIVPLGYPWNPYNFWHRVSVNAHAFLICHRVTQKLLTTAEYIALSGPNVSPVCICQMQNAWFSCLSCLINLL